MLINRFKCAMCKQFVWNWFGIAIFLATAAVSAVVSINSFLTCMDRALATAVGINAIDFLSHFGSSTVLCAHTAPQPTERTGCISNQWIIIPFATTCPHSKNRKSLYLSKYPSFEFIGLLLVHCTMCHTTKNHIYGFSNRKINTETEMANIQFLLNETEVHVKTNSTFQHNSNQTASGHL